MKNQYKSIEQIVVANISRYPSLFYKPAWKDSMLSVLDHLFLTLGNGEDLEKCEDGLFRFAERTEYYDKNKNVHVPLTEDIISRIKAGEKLVSIQDIEYTRIGKGNRWYSHRINLENIYFLSTPDVLAHSIPYSVINEFEGEDGDRCFKKAYIVYPEKKGPMGQENTFHPYTHFAFFYLPFIQILSAYKKIQNPYIMEDYKVISPEDIKELEILLPKDYIDAIKCVVENTIGYMDDLLKNPEKISKNSSKSFITYQKKILKYITKGLALIK